MTNESERKCIECGEPLIKRKHESEARYLAKKFCSALCSRENMKRERRGWWSPQADRNKPFNYE